MNFANLKDDDSAPHATPADAPAEDASTDADPSSEDAEFVAKERKPINQTAVTLFVIIAIGTAVTYVMHLRTGPQSARAADPAVANAEVAINDFMRGGSGNITLLRRLLDGTARVVEQFKDYTNVAQVPLGDLKANPFQSSVAKSAQVEDTDEIGRKKKEEEHALVVKAAQAMQLQTVVIHGSRKTCIISNTMYREGDAVGKFTVEKITPTAVVVVSGPYRFELSMSR